MLHPVCGGIEVHAAQLTACLRRGSDEAPSTTELVDCGTMDRARIAVRTWWPEQQCPVVALQSTDVSGKLVYHVLRAAAEVYVAHSHDVRQRPGHTTDQRDGPWIADLLAHGLIKPSVVPLPEMRAWRDLTRPRVSRVRTRTHAKNRVYKMLDDTNITLASVVSDVFGKRARCMWEALVTGARAPAKLSALALGTLRRQSPPRAVALAGQLTAPHARRSAGALAWGDVRGRQMAEIAQPLQEFLGPMAPQLEQLDSLPGVDEMTARDILAARGLAMTRFGSAERLAAWAGLSPGHNESAGKRRKGRTRRSNRSLRRVLGQWAWATRQTSTFGGECFAAWRHG